MRVKANERRNDSDYIKAITETDDVPENTHQQTFSELQDRQLQHHDVHSSHVDLLIICVKQYNTASVHSNKSVDVIFAFDIDSVN